MKTMLAQKKEVALALAQLHHEIDPGVRPVYRLLSPGKMENDPNEPLKLLEVNEATIPTGILPLSFPPQPEEGLPFPTIILEITPEEFAKVETQEWKLPKGWKLGPWLPASLINGSVQRP